MQYVISNGSNQAGAAPIKPYNVVSQPELNRNKAEISVIEGRFHGGERGIRLIRTMQGPLRTTVTWGSI
jgi:hypothetical protein